jgi:hypothetical protein
MKVTAIALASAIAISSTCASAHTARDNSYPVYGNTAPSIALPQKYRKSYESFRRAGITDPWGHLGSYYGPMISTGAISFRIRMSNRAFSRTHFRISPRRRDGTLRCAPRAN